jgi:pimeloyl-ACP methyl ester carboxylesterase
MTTWILLRGLTRESAHWGTFPESFRRAVGATEVITPDLPGSGTRYHERSSIRMEAIAEAVRCEVRRTSHSPPYRVLALSLGAMAAVAWTRDHPAEISHLVLANTSFRGVSPFWRRMRWRTYPGVLDLLVRWSDTGYREDRVFAMTSAAEFASPALLAQWRRIARDRPVTRGDALRQFFAAARFRGHAVPPAATTLLLASLGDRLVHPRCSQALAERWQVPLALHPWAGHDLFLDDPQWVERQVRDWLATTSTTGNGSTVEVPVPIADAARSS